MGPSQQTSEFHYKYHKWQGLSLAEFGWYSIFSQCLSSISWNEISIERLYDSCHMSMTQEDYLQKMAFNNKNCHSNLSESMLQSMFIVVSLDFELPVSSIPQKGWPLRFWPRQDSLVPWSPDWNLNSYDVTRWRFPLHGGTPSDHPCCLRRFPEINHPSMAFPHFKKPPQWVFYSVISQRLTTSWDAQPLSRRTPDRVRQFGLRYGGIAGER